VLTRSIRNLTERRSRSQQRKLADRLSESRDRDYSAEYKHELKLKYQEQTMKECTFAPNIHRKKKKKYSFKNFISNQNKFMEEKRVKSHLLK
jgi:hypothetical protein